MPGEKKWGPMELDDNSSSSTATLGKTFDVVRMYVRESIWGSGMTDREREREGVRERKL